MNREIPAADAALNACAPLPDLSIAGQASVLAEARAAIAKAKRRNRDDIRDFLLDALRDDLDGTATA
jgi:hypothetical protein